MRFFDRFRLAERRYSPGVHELGDPASESAVAEAAERVGVLPPEYQDFLLQWNGAYLFHDDYALFGVAGARPELQRLARADAAAEGGALVEFAVAPDRRLLFDTAGRVLARDLATEETAVEGSDFACWLDAVMAREGALYGRDGEFREEAFAGGELSDGARRRRAELALRADPQSPAWLVEVARELAEGGEPLEAIDHLERAVALDPAAAATWSRLGRLLREAGDAARAAQAFTRAAETERDDEEAAFAWASAARAAGEAGLADADTLGRRAAHRMPGFVAQQRAAAAHLGTEGDLEAAIERLALAAAVDPADDALRIELGRARARLALSARS